MAHYESDFFAAIFGTKPETTVDLSFYGDSLAFRKAQRHSMLYVASESGVFNPLANRVFVFHRWSAENTAFHEVSHALYHYYSWRHPVWLDEGIATYFKYVLWDSLDNPTVGRSISRTVRMKRYVSDSTFSIRRLLRCTPMHFYRNDRSRNYDISWGIVYYLQTYHAETFRKIVARSQTALQSSRAVDSEYPGGIDGLEQDLKTFYSGFPK